MKRMFLLITVVLALLVAGCGSQVTVVVPLIQSPEITAARFSQDVVNRFVDGAIDYYAPDTDLDTVTVLVSDDRGVTIARSVTELAAFSGIVRGTITLSVDYLTYLPGTYTITVYLTDRAGLFSNSVYHTFRVP